MIEKKLSVAKSQIKAEEFNIGDLADEVRVDGLCRTLLQQFHDHLLNSGEVTRHQAGSMAHGADFFLRDFVIDCLRSNIFSVTEAQVRGFAGNWYIHRTLEPNAAELTAILGGVAAFYRYCADLKWVSGCDCDGISSACSDLDYYQQRIDSFHALAGDDYLAWCQKCPLN